MTPEAMGIGDRPVVMGALPMQGLAAIPSQGRPARDLPALVDDLFASGYAGAWSWAYNDPGFPWDGPAMHAFADTHACEIELDPWERAAARSSVRDPGAPGAATAHRARRGG